jgi:hypothetical protein
MRNGAAAFCLCIFQTPEYSGVLFATLLVTDIVSNPRHLILLIQKLFGLYGRQPCGAAKTALVLSGYLDSI